MLLFDLRASLRPKPSPPQTFSTLHRFKSPTNTRTGIVTQFGRGIKLLTTYLLKLRKEAFFASHVRQESPIEPARAYPILYHSHKPNEPLQHLHRSEMVKQNNVKGFDDRDSPLVYSLLEHGLETKKDAGETCNMLAQQPLGPTTTTRRPSRHHQ